MPVCPVSAIFALDDLPEKWAEFAEVNAKHFKRDPVSEKQGVADGVLGRFGGQIDCRTRERS